MNLIETSVQSRPVTAADSAQRLFEDNIGEVADERRVPGRALAISFAALAVPLITTLWMPEAAGDYEALLWLLPLVPAFLLAYYRGAAGVAAALALGMAALTIAHVAGILLGRPVQGGLMLTLVIAFYIGICLGVAWLSNRLNEDRKALERLVLTDSLTGLATRRYAKVFIAKEFAAAQRGRKLAVVLFDIDHFKAYNDKHGHAAGDDALQCLGEAIGGMTRASSLAARLGGEEFMAILPDTDDAGALLFAERVQERLGKSAVGADVTVSIGIAAYHDHGSPEALVAAADRALYAAKAAGRNCIRVHDARFY